MVTGLFPVTLAGQKGTGAYLDDSMALCDESQAVFLKVVFDNGKRAFYRVTMPTKALGSAA